MIFLKLGGSLITDKDKLETPRPEVMKRLAKEIHTAMQERPDLRLLLGHGAGSFGHRAAAKHGTHLGASGQDAWLGFAEVWYAAHRLNQLFLEILRAEGIPAISFPPSASASSRDGELISMAIEPIRQCLDAGLLPVIFGDVAFDATRGASILSTEKLFAYLGAPLRPSLMLFAGLEPGVWADFPRKNRLMDEVSSRDLAAIHLEGTAGTDVTGGMAGKVRQSISMARTLPGLEVRIFSGESTDAVRTALMGAPVGTLVRP
ncbi:MAG: isopentenyl phosphate kinase [Anaerolineales bacterium]